MNLLRAPPLILLFLVAYYLHDFCAKGEKEVIVGTLLGDASSAERERNKPTHNARIRFEQSYPNHEAYLLSLYEIFSNICGKAPRIISRKPDKRTGKVYQTISFKGGATLNFEALNYYFELFYIYNTTTVGKDSKEAKRRKIKIVPDNIQDLLTPRALARPLGLGLWTTGA